MSAVLVDSNVILDIFTEDAVWYTWSADKLGRCADEATLAINPRDQPSNLFRSLPSIVGQRDTSRSSKTRFPVSPSNACPCRAEAAFLAGKCFAEVPILLLRCSPE